MGRQWKMCAWKILTCLHLRPLYYLGHHYTKWGQLSYIHNFGYFLSSRICFTCHGWTVIVKPLLEAHEILGLHSPIAHCSLPKIHLHLVAQLLHSLICEQISMNISSMLHIGQCGTLQLFHLTLPHNANWLLQCSCFVHNCDYLAWICMHHCHTWHVLAMFQHQPCSGFHMPTYCCMYRPMLMVGKNKPPC